MSRLSDSVRGIVGEGGDGWEVYRMARAMLARGEAVVALTIGDHDFPTPAPIVDACKAALDAGRHHYPPILGMEPLREAVARRIAARTGAPTLAENVAICPGGQAALFAAANVALDPGDEAVVVTPYYATFAQTVRAAGGVARLAAARPEHGFQPRPEDLAAAITPRTRMLLLNTPSNPTGAVYSRETLEAAAALCRERDLWLVSDEVYETMVHHGAHVSPRALPGMAERTLVVGSMSKSHGMTGWRAGWLAGPAEAIAAVGDLALVITYGMTTFVQDAMLAALTAGPDAEREIAERYRRRRDIACAGLAASRRLRVHRPAGGIFVMADVRAITPDGEAFALALLERERIAVTPGESFGAAGAGHIRLSLGAEDATLAEACARIARFADEWNGS